MLTHQLLTEDRAQFIATASGDKLVAAARAETGKDYTAQAVVAQLLKADPTQQQNLQWITNQYLKRQFRLEDISRVHDELVQFEQIKSRLPSSDINKYTYHTMADEVRKAFAVTELSDDVSDTSIPDVKVLYDGPLGKLVIPLTKEAAIAVGRGTSWCTASKKVNRFDEYLGAPLNVWKDVSGERIQLWFFVPKAPLEIEFRDEYYDESLEDDRPVDAQVKDIRDDDLSPQDIQKWRKHPVLGKLFAQHEKILVHNGTKKGAENMLMYAQHTIQGRWPECERHILRFPLVAAMYAADILKGKWPEGERFIIRDKNAIMKYSTEALHGRWPEAEHIILMDAYSSYQYATRVIKARWPEAEQIISKDQTLARQYNKAFGTNI